MAVTTVVPEEKDLLMGVTVTTVVPENKDGMGLTPVALVIIVVLSVLVVILLCIVIGIFLKKNKTLSMKETVEENHYYDESAIDNIDNKRSKVVDTNEYYDE